MKYLLILCLFLSHHVFASFAIPTNTDEYTMAVVITESWYYDNQSQKDLENIESISTELKERVTQFSRDFYADGLKTFASGMTNIVGFKTSVDKTLATITMGLNHYIENEKSKIPIYDTFYFNFYLTMLSKAQIKDLQNLKEKDDKMVSVTTINLPNVGALPFYHLKGKKAFGLFAAHTRSTYKNIYKNGEQQSVLLGINYNVSLNQNHNSTGLQILAGLEAGLEVEVGQGNDQVFVEKMVIPSQFEDHDFPIAVVSTRRYLQDDLNYEPTIRIDFGNYGGIAGRSMSTFYSGGQFQPNRALFGISNCNTTSGHVPRLVGKIVDKNFIKLGLTNIVPNIDFQIFSLEFYYSTGFRIRIVEKENDEGAQFRVNVYNAEHPAISLSCLKVGAAQEGLSSKLDQTVFEMTNQFFNQVSEYDSAILEMDIF